MIGDERGATDSWNEYYLAIPENPLGMGVIVIQEWWGLVPHIEAVTDRFAEAGFTALAPDLYDGETTTSPDEAQRMFMALNIERTAKALEATVDCLLKHPASLTRSLALWAFVWADSWRYWLQL